MCIWSNILLIISKDISFHIDIMSITEMLGTLTIPQPMQTANAESHMESSLNASQDLEKSSMIGMVKKFFTDDSKSTQASAKNAAEIKPPKQLMPKPSLQSRFNLRYNSLPSLACAGSDRAWVKTRDKKLQRVDGHGYVKDTIEPDFNFSDVKLSTKGEVILADTSNNCIKTISHTMMFFTNQQALCKMQWKPSGFCCLHTREIAVAFCAESRVLIYSTSGKDNHELEGENI